MVAAADGVFGKIIDHVERHDFIFNYVRFQSTGNLSESDIDKDCSWSKEVSRDRRRGLISSVFHSSALEYGIRVYRPEQRITQPIGKDQTWLQKLTTF